MINKRAAVLLLGVLLMALSAGCGKKDNQTTEVPSIISYSSETETVQTTAAVTTAESTETEGSSSEEETTVAETEEAPVRTYFFGRPVSEEVCDVNESTLRIKGSGLYDVMSGERFTCQEVIRMIESYSLPRKAYYGGAEFTNEVAGLLYAARNLQALEEMGAEDEIAVRYGILTDNADMRSFPTLDTATETTDEKAFDYFQETMLPLASGVIVLHQTEDAEWSFVQADNYYGWIRTENIGFTDLATFKSYLSGDDFIVSLTARMTVSGKTVRLGTTIPYEYAGNDEFLLLFPERDENGAFHTTSVPLPDNGLVSDGYLTWSPDTLLMLASNLIGTPYGWGVTFCNYDCSSTIGLLYRCFGIYLPRNTSQMKKFGGTVIDVSALDYEEKLQVIEHYPGAVLVMPGHAMLYSSVWYKNTESTEADHFVIHNTSGFYTDETAETFNEYYSVTESALENMFRANGESFVSRIQTILLFEENTADEAE